MVGINSASSLMFSAFLPQPYTWFITESGWRVCGSARLLLREGKRHEVAENESKLSGEAEPVCRAVLRAVIMNVQWFQFCWLLRFLSRAISPVSSRQSKCGSLSAVHEGICKGKKFQLSQEYRELTKKGFSSWVITLGTDKIFSLSSPVPCPDLSQIFLSQGVKSWWPLKNILIMKR